MTSDIKKKVKPGLKDMKNINFGKFRHCFDNLLIEKAI